MHKFLVLYLIAFVLFSCQSKTNEVYSTEEGAIGGYDPVAYFREEKPVKGDKQFVADWNNAKWYFSSEENLTDFKTDPLKYAPQYGGYCAYGTAEGHKAPTQPDAWTIVDDKLYLNYDTDVKSVWMKDQTKLILKADSNWSSVKLMD
jgi:YHS domain-containing protein